MIHPYHLALLIQQVHIVCALVDPAYALALFMVGDNAEGDNE